MACVNPSKIYTGTSPELTFEVRDPETNALIAPASFVVVVTLPDNTTETKTYSVGASGWSNPSTGIYKLIYSVTQSGWHTADGTATKTSGASGKERVGFEAVA